MPGKFVIRAANIAELKLSWYKLKLECDNFKVLNAMSMVTTEQIAIESE